MYLYLGECLRSSGIRGFVSVLITPSAVKVFARIKECGRPWRSKLLYTFISVQELVAAARQLRSDLKRVAAALVDRLREIGLVGAAGAIHVRGADADEPGLVTLEDVRKLRAASHVLDALVPVFAGVTLCDRCERKLAQALSRAAWRLRKALGEDDLKMASIDPDLLDPDVLAEDPDARLQLREVLAGLTTHVRRAAEALMAELRYRAQAE